VRITYVISGLGTGGAELMLLKLLERSPVLRQGRVLVLKDRGELGDRFRALGVSVDFLGIRANPSAIRSFSRLVRLLREDRPDVVSTWMYHADLFGGLAARIAGVPVVWGIRNSTLGAESKLRTRLVVRAAALLSSWIPETIVSCSRKAIDVHSDLGYIRDRFRLIPNGFDTELFRPCSEARSAIRRELGIGDGVRLVGMVARFDPQKNFAGFLAAAASVRKRRRDVHFVLAGAGIDSTNEALAQLVERHQLVGAISMLGPRSDVPRLMAALDVCVLSSIYGEAFPNVLGEAMACGVPCVTTDVGDSAEIVGETGLVVAPGDDDALATGILHILSLSTEQWSALGESARARVMSVFSIDATASRFECEFAKTARSALPENRQ
jgi:glycosyltransferase involved in cell wall biosynthesis